MLGPTGRKTEPERVNCMFDLPMNEVALGRVPVPVTVLAAPVYFGAHVTLWR